MLELLSQTKELPNSAGKPYEILQNSSTEITLSGSQKPSRMPGFASRQHAITSYMPWMMSSWLLRI
jgi:hypothetical protein